MSDIKVSIMIPAYNVEQYIERSIRSACEQTLQDIEIIVVNDGSTDNTSSIINALSEKDSRIIVVNKENGGLPSARNAALRIAKGEYSQILDGDDWLEPEACEELYAFAQENQLDLVVTDYFIDDDHGQVVSKTVFEKADKIFDRDEALKLTYIESDSAMLCNRFVRREMYNGVIFPDEVSYGEDLLATTKIEIASTRIGKYNKAFYHYIYNPSSITKDGVGKKMHQYFYAFLLIRELLKEAGLLEKHEKHLKVLEANKVAFFMFQKNYFGDKNYEKSLEMVLTYLKTHSKPSRDISRIRRIFVSVLSFYPSRLTFYLLSKSAQFLRGLHGT